MSAAKRKNTILIVDDEPELRQILCDLLSETGAELFQAADGREAWSFLQDRTVDLVVTDLRMPNMDGIELCKRIAEARLPTSTMIVTGYGEVQAFSAALKCGVFDLIAKPFDDDVVIGRVKNALELRNVSRSISEMLDVLVYGLEFKTDRKFDQMAPAERLQFLEALTHLASLRIARMKAKE